MSFDHTGQVIDQGAKEVTVPAGEYVLGDPCYTFPRDHWMALLNSCDFFRDGPGHAAGLEVVAFGTAWGDGSYEGSNGFEYAVDAGLIGLVPVFEGMEHTPHLTTRVVFTEPTKCSTDGKGRLKFGDIEINTNDADDSGCYDDYEYDPHDDDWDTDHEYDGDIDSARVAAR